MDTQPERLLRSMLHQAGLRYRKDYPVDADGRAVRVDVVFPRARIAVFVDGCFWHSCPLHGTTPRHNAEYWIPKLARNVQRDRQTDAILESAGWLVIRVWEHEPAADALAQIRSLVQKRVRSTPLDQAQRDRPDDEVLVPDVIKAPTTAPAGQP